MTKMRLSVDTGSVHLPAGEDNLGLDAGRRTSGEADPMAVSSFRQAFDGSRPAAPEWMLDEEPELQSPFALLGRAGGDWRAPQPSEIGAEIERLWVSQGGVGGVREVRMGMSESLLPGTAVRIHEAGGFLQVELRVTMDATRQWMASALPQLVQDLGERLNRPVRATLLGRGEGKAFCVEWPEAA